MKRYFLLLLPLLLSAEQSKSEAEWVEKHSIHTRGTHLQHKNEERLNDYEKSPGAHRYFDDPDWPDSAESTNKYLF